MSKYIYEVSIDRGRSNPEYRKFFENVSALKAVSPDFGGINGSCIISHHMDSDTVRLLCSENIKKKSSITVEEITKETLNPKAGDHKMYTKLIEKYFLPYGDYPNIR
jgi:hypothetical protein